MIGSLKNCKILITGGTGFLGRCLLEHLLILKKNNYDFNPEITLLSRHCHSFLIDNPQYNQLKIKPISSDIKDAELPKTVFDYIIHAATPATSNEALDLITTASPTLTNLIVGSTQKILSFCNLYNPQALIFISSGSVYRGLNLPSPWKEEYFDPTKDIHSINIKHNYQQGKQEAEQLLLNSHLPFKTYIARCFSFIGPELNYNSYLIGASFFKEALEKKQITLNSNGKALTSFLYSKDLAAWLFHILLKGSNRIYNIGSPESLSIEEFANKVINHIPSGKVSLPHSLFSHPTQGEDYVPCLKKSFSEFQLKLTRIDNAIEETVKCYKNFNQIS